LNAVTNNETPANGISLGTFLWILAAGVLCKVLPAFITLLWLSAIFITVWGILKNRSEYIWYTIAASPVLEVLSRVGKAPAVPDESGKYFLIFALFALLIYHFRNRTPHSLFSTGKLIVYLLLPSIFVGLSSFNLDQWAFNGLAIFELGFLLAFISYERWDVEAFCKTMHYVIMAITLIVVFITLKTPDVDKVTYSLIANSETSGGMASNQVSTILGLGILLSSLMLMLKRPFLRINILNYLFIGFLLFRGLLTFSRGGMLMAAIGILIAFMFKLFSNRKSFIKFTFLACLVGVTGYLAVSKINSMTHGTLLLRYEGETKGTWSGYREKSLNTVTAGRSNLILTDIKIFRDNFLFGVGPGGAKALRRQYDQVYLDFSVAAHTEFSRLLSEHGVGGLAVVIILLFFPVIWIKKQKNTLWKGVSAAIFIYALGTSTHSAMRTNVTSVYYALAAVPVYYISRKRITVEETEEEELAILPDAGNNLP
jgi:hypothetical protein